MVHRARAAGQVSWSHESDLGAGPRYHLWGRIGDGKIFRFGADTQTLAAGERGRLQIYIYHGTWASPDGTLATPHAVYDSLAGGIEVLVIRWGDVAPDEGLAALAFLAPSDRLIAAECTRLGSVHELPRGFEPLSPAAVTSSMARRSMERR